MTQVASSVSSRFHRASPEVHCLPSLQPVHIVARASSQTQLLALEAEKVAFSFESGKIVAIQEFQEDTK